MDLESEDLCLNTNSPIFSCVTLDDLSDSVSSPKKENDNDLPHVVVRGINMIKYVNVLSHLNSTVHSK